ncbi:hypothetical protein NHX12_028783 [Muraenolepis orangiensis]|uniref:Uncharacterized protein n=1 Tax=Muraenolepis orangiensis TaxID=630683 RepID=A0A9Q0EA19_9TELE|nr:hypothetical protein NHX12_028783 [Muraenolepis orangiensis]
MTDPPVNHPPDRSRVCYKVSLGCESLDYHSDADAVCEQHQRHAGSERIHQDLEHSERRKPTLVRSKTFDHSLLNHVPQDSEVKVERKKSHYSQLSKTNSQYHKIFKDICKEELLRQIFGKDTKIAIPVVSITHIKKTKTAILVPNALVVATSRDREMSPSSSPFPTAKSSFRVQSELEVRREDLEESSSSDSPTPDHHKMAEYPVPTLLEVLKHAEDPDSLDRKTQQSPALQPAEPLCSGPEEPPETAGRGCCMMSSLPEMSSLPDDVIAAG